MKNHLNFKLSQFIKKQGLEGKNLLVAVSCGVDSMVLLSRLLELKKNFKLNLSVAHVHHGWRLQSDEEFLFLEGYCQKHGIPFFGTHLKLDPKLQDPENTARVLRYEFFEKIYHAINADGLLLGHQKQDLDETVIKRIFEGASIFNSHGMKELSRLKGMVIMRPFLYEDKASLYEDALKAGVTYFEDETNSDKTYLRTRLRQDFFPHLEAVFGKKLGDNLVHFSEQAFSIRQYFESKFQELCDLIKIDSCKECMLLSPNLQLLEIEAVLQIWFSYLKIGVSRQIMKDLIQALQSSSEPKQFQVNQLKLYASAGFCFLEKKLEQETEFLTYQSLDENVNCLQKMPKWFQKKFLPSS